MKNCIKKIRKRLGITQKKLSEDISCNRKMLSHWENNRRRISLDMSKKIADALGVKVEDLIESEDENRN